MYLGIYLKKFNQTKKQKNDQTNKNGKKKKDKKKQERKEGMRRTSNPAPSARCDFT